MNQKSLRTKTVTWQNTLFGYLKPSSCTESTENIIVMIRDWLNTGILKRKIPKNDIICEIIILPWLHLDFSSRKVVEKQKSQFVCRIQPISYKFNPRNLVYKWSITIVFYWRDISTQLLNIYISGKDFSRDRLFPPIR